MSSKTPALAAVLATALAGAVQAQPAPPAAVQPGTYAIEASHARVLFAVNHLGFSTWYGDFSQASGTLVLDPKTPANSHVEISVPTASVSTTNAVLDGELKSPDWFDAVKFPTIAFKSTKVTATAANRAEVQGDLTLHGVTRPVTLTATFNAAGANPMNKAYTVGFEVTGKIKRSDFGVTRYVPAVGDEVTLIISAPFVRNPG